MNPTSYYNMVFSGLTMSFMDDFGYYKSNFEMEEFLIWGQDTKCDAFAGACSTHPHVCPGGTQLCSLDLKSMGKCAVDRFVESCPVFTEVPDHDCLYSENKEKLIKDETVVGVSRMTFGKGSRCVRGIVDMDQIEIVRCLGLGCNAIP